VLLKPVLAECPQPGRRLAIALPIGRRRMRARAPAVSRGRAVTAQLVSKGIHYGSLTAFPDGSVDTTNVEGVNPDLRVRRFSSREDDFDPRVRRGGAQCGNGLQSVDPDLAAAHAGGRVVTPSGTVLDGSQDAIEAPPSADAANGNEIPVSWWISLSSTC